MTFSKLQKVAITSTGICLGLSAGLDLLNAPSAHALSSQQLSQAANAIQYIRGKGCRVTTENSAFKIICSTKVVANMVQPELDASQIKLYNSRGKSYARFKVGRNGNQQTTRISNVYYNPRGPLNLKIMPDNVNSRKIQMRGTRNGFQFITSFESSGTEFEVQDKYFGNWCDRCFPDVHWNQGKITANLQLTPNMRLSSNPQIAVNGQWMLRGNLDVIPDQRVNTSLSNSMSTLLSQNAGRVNSLVTGQLNNLARRLPNNIRNNISYSFRNGNISVRVPVR